MSSLQRQLALYAIGISLLATGCGQPSSGDVSEAPVLTTEAAPPSTTAVADATDEPQLGVLQA